ncbi:MAG: CAP domain-containing protein [Xenococcaceae cyanobacterium]
MLKRYSGIFLGIIMLVGGLESCQSPSSLNARNNSPVVPSKPASSEISNSGSLTTLEQSIHQQVNQYRQSLNLPALRLEPRISQQARIHSERMAKGTVPFSHAGFEQRVQAIGREISYRSAAENVAVNQGYGDPATQAVQGWIRSSGHRQNMEGQFDLTGIGVAKNAAGEYYFTQIFIWIK